MRKLENNELERKSVADFKAQQNTDYYRLR
jgi:hypothetical protein